MSLASSRDSVIDCIKAFASQAIVVHHLALYGPLADTAFPALPALLQSWIRDYALMAVQAFLVVGGYLAAAAHARAGSGLSLTALAWRRYWRLMLPYAVALTAAIACAALARALIQHHDTPAAPTLAQVAAHLLLLQGLLDQPSLSLGVWYIGIDVQLYVLLLVLLRLSGERATMFVAALTALSLLWLNRLDLDAWAPYFFGAYGLGFLAQRLAVAERTQALRFGVLLAAVVAAALLVDWRGRLVVAGTTALLLVIAAQARLSWRWLASAPVAWLGRISYAVFLIHYPVVLLVGALVERLWPNDVAAATTGLLLAWLLSLAAGTLLHHAVERRGSRAGRTTRLATSG